MPKCPNCDQATARTEDWACPWCGYPLLSGSYQKIAKTYRQLKEEGLPKQEPLLREEIETSLLPNHGALPPMHALEPEPVSEPEQVAKAEPESVPKPKPKPRSKPKSKSKSKSKPKSRSNPKPEPVLETEPEPAAEPESVPEPEPELKSESIPEAQPVLDAEPESVPEPEPVLEPEIEVTVEELLSAYAADGVAADAKFVNKTLKVTGAVDRIEVKDTLDIYYVNLTSAEANLLQNVKCVFDRKHGTELNGLTKGQTVTVQGKYDGSIMDIRMSDCVLVH